MSDERVSIGARGELGVFPLVGVVDVDETDSVATRGELDRVLRDVTLFSGSNAILGSGAAREYVQILPDGDLDVVLYLYGEDARDLLLPNPSHGSHSHTSGINGDPGGACIARCNIGTTATTVGSGDHTLTTTSDSFAPTSVQIWVNGVNVTATVGDPNLRGSEHYVSGSATWGPTSVASWSTGALDLTAVAGWSAGQHTIEFRETGGRGGLIRHYIHVGRSGLP